MPDLPTNKTSQPNKLKRTLTLPYVVLYGLGVTVGAGIYVLLGEVITRSGDFAPVSFLIAGLVMLLPAACFAELTGRMPYAAAEAHFVGTGFKSPRLFLLVGLAVAVVGLISSAAIAHGAVGYLSQLIDWPVTALLIMVILATGLISGVEIRNSIAMAGLLTLIEVGGLLSIVIGSIWAGNDLGAQAIKAIPTSMSPVLWSGIAASSLLAFFAFIGFEDIDSIAEETVNPQRTLSRGIFITLVLTVTIYIVVILAALAAVPIAEISGNSAPLTTVFAKTTAFSPLIITLIAIVATVNGIIVQLIMSSRVVYGLANRGSLPKILASINTRTNTPLNATGFSVMLVMGLAIAFPINRLAEWTSAITLAIFILVCAALIAIKKDGSSAPKDTFIVPIWVPYGGIIACAALLLAGLAAG